MLVVMPEVLVATPLKYNAVSRPYSLSEGVSIRQLSPIRWEVALAKHMISDEERTKLARTQYWLVVAQECRGAYGAGDEIYELAASAAMSLQIICPTGASHIFLHFQEEPDGWDNTGIRHPKELNSTLLGRISRLEDRGLQEFNAIYQGIRRAEKDKLIRLQNPILLLEHGQQIGTATLSHLMYVMGLDILFMAGESKNFVPRIGGFMGLDTLLFPPDSLHRQPALKVRDVLSHLYELRNIIAHGREIPKTPYREPYPITGTSGEQVNFEPLLYGDVLLEASLFLLTAALRKIFVEGLYDLVADEKKWKAELTRYEHRFKNAGGVRTAKERGG